LLFGHFLSRTWQFRAFRQQNSCSEALFLLLKAQSDAKTGKNTGVLLV
jgi:hypothetical protein